MEIWFFNPPIAEVDYKRIISCETVGYSTTLIFIHVNSSDQTNRLTSYGFGSIVTLNLIIEVST